jgi:Tol biopolymer transport system component
LYFYDIGGGIWESGIYHIDLAADEPRAELLDPDGFNFDVSPSGNRLAYLSGGIHILDLYNLASTLLVSGDIIGVSWYNEDTLVYEVFAGHMYLVTVSTGESSSVFDGFGSYPDVSSSGEVVFAGGGRMASLLLGSAEATELLTYPGTSELLAYPMWSPDGRSIVYEYLDHNGPWEVRLLHLDEDRRVDILASDARYPVFVDSDMSIIYVRWYPEQRKDINGQIWRMEIDGSNKTPVTEWQMIRYEEQQQ